MATTSNVDIGESDGWTKLGGDAPAAITIKCNDNDAVWHLALAATEPAAGLVGEVYRGEQSWEGYELTGSAVWVRVERDADVNFAVTV